MFTPAKAGADRRFFEWSPASAQTPLAREIADIAFGDSAMTVKKLRRDGEKAL